MFKSEKIFLFLLITVCLIISLVVIDALMDPALLIRTAYARFTGTEETAGEGLFLPELFGDQAQGQLVEGATEFLQDSWNLYRSVDFAFEIQYPKVVEQKSIPNQDALNAGLGLMSETPIWQFQLDEPAFYKGTNLLEASVLVNVLEGKDQQAYCSSFKEGSVYQAPGQNQDELLSVEINGIPFWKDEVLEGVMGEFYRRISYRTFQKGACYEVTELLHYQNLDSISEEQVIQFDEDQVLSALDQMVSSFSFLDVEPTFPEQTYPVPKTVSSAVSKATSSNVDGLDVSHWQGTINWTKVRNAGYVFTFAKGTEGVGWTDVKFHENMVNGDNAGVVMGVYHFARPDLGNSAVDEANHFVDVAGEYLQSGYLRPVLDLEVGASLGKTALSNWVLKWMQTVESKTGIAPLIYTNPSYITNYLTPAVTEYDLWVAHWTCNPTPSYYFPNTGMWRDWAFWQYYGPGGCGGNAGYVPGITTNIDLNIFNGVESGLQAYDAATTQVWVSLISDTYYAPTPYYADITANINGDYDGLIDFSLWWDCDSRETDVGVVEGTCGTLPEPDDGTCLKNEVGMKCLGVEEDIQVGENTYTAVGNYTAKVIAQVADHDPVEDRYKISTYNPIRLVILKPTSPAEGAVGSDFILTGKVDIKTTVSGALQFSVEDPVTKEVIASKCRIVAGDTQSIQEFNLKLTQADEAEIVYQTQARYRPSGSCPIADQNVDDVSKIYVINWVDHNAYLEIQDESSELIADGAVYDLGEVEPLQVGSLGTTLVNLSPITPLQITDVSFHNISNVTNLQFEPVVPITVEPNEEVPLLVSYQVQSSGPFSFDIVLDHDASNPTPFRFTVTGSGKLADNPLQSITANPLSPGENLIGDPYELHADVDIDPPAQGVLQVSVEDSQGSSLSEPVCIAIPAGLASYGFEHTWSESASGQVSSQIWARYREAGSCPIADTSDYDISQSYQVNWVEDTPVLELTNSDLESIAQGGVDDLGVNPAYQTLGLEYQISNPSETTSFQISDVAFEAVDNLVEINTTTQLPLEIGPESLATLEFQLEVGDPGEFSADVRLEHTASNPTPFDYSVQGTGELTANPIQSLTPQPLSPGQVLIKDIYDLQVAAEVDAPVSGALEISATNPDGSLVESPFCQEISEPGSGLYTYQLGWSEAKAGLKEYIIAAAFYSRGGCPGAGSPVSELSLPYQVEWQEETPELAVLNQSDTQLASGSTVDLGQYEYYQTVNLNYRLVNSSSTTGLEVTGIQIENLSNISEVDLLSASSLVLGPDQEGDLGLSFLTSLTGDFTFDLVIEHTGSNPSPYRITFQGTGVMTDNPLKYLSADQPSPGTSLIGNPYSLDIEVGLDLPDQGALQVSMIDKASGELSDQYCQNLVNNLDQSRTFGLVINQSTPGSREYTLSAKYRAQGSCPIEDNQDNDLSQTYTILWEEQIPSLEVSSSDGANLAAGLLVDIGDQEFYQQIQRTYQLRNTSSTTNLEVNSLSVDDLINVDQVSIDTSGPITLLPGEEKMITLSFRVARISAFSLTVNIVHSGENPSPFTFSVAGTGVLTADPILSLSADPQSPGSLYIGEEYKLQIQVEIDPPAPGVLRVALDRQDSPARMGETCFEILGEHSFVDVDLSWEEANPGQANYDLDVAYQALGSCPLEGAVDGEYHESYQVNWMTHQPELIVNRPEGVTIFAGAVDYIGVHDFFRFVEVTYLITNGNDAEPLVITDIVPENLENLREVLVSPEGPIEIQPGESQEIKISFQVLTLDPYSFDLVWNHNGSNPSPYVTGIMGNSNLNLGDAPTDSWLYRFLESLIRSGFFLKLPIFGLIVLRRKKKRI